jgi:thioredoxin-related protein
VDQESEIGNRKPEIRNQKSENGNRTTIEKFPSSAFRFLTSDSRPINSRVTKQGPIFITIQHMIRRLFLFLFTTVIIAGTASAQQHFTEVLSAAKDSGKNVLIVFSGSDWCIPCIKMEKQVFLSNAFKEYAREHLVVVHADFPRLKKNQLPKEQQTTNEALADKYNSRGSFPMTVLTDPNGTVLQEWPGYEDKLTASLFIEQLEMAVHAGK